MALEAFTRLLMFGVRWMLRPPPRSGLFFFEAPRPVPGAPRRVQGDQKKTKMGQTAAFFNNKKPERIGGMDMHENAGGEGEGAGGGGRGMLEGEGVPRAPDQLEGDPGPELDVGDVLRGVQVAAAPAPPAHCWKDDSPAGKVLVT